MSSRCTVCNHPRRAEIDKALRAGESSTRRLAKQYGLGPGSIQRHKSSGHHELTPCFSEQIVELTPSLENNWRNDSVLFAREALGFNPLPWQEQALQSEKRRLALRCHRQSGKSTVCAALALHKAIFFASSLVLILSPTDRQSAELFRKVTLFRESLPFPLRLTEDNARSCRLDNGSRIIALPGQNPSNVRGYSSPALVVIDEAAFCSDELFSAVMPMLTMSRGTLALISTPRGKDGFFFNTWENGGEEWEKILFTAPENPFITAQDLTEFERQHSERDYRQEFLCEFIESSGGRVFSDSLLKGVFNYVIF